MELDWSEVKKTTLWHYEELIEKMQKVLSYNFVQKHYNHNMKEAQDYVTKLLSYDSKHATKVSMLAEFLRRFDSQKVKSYADLVHQVRNKEKCEEFLRKTELPFRDLVSALNYVFRWVLPFNIYLRELIDVSNEAHGKHLEELRKHGIKFNLDILEKGRTREDRKKISKETGIPETFIHDLVNHADMTRLPYSNRKTVKHLYAAGYDSLDKLAKTEPKRLTENMKAYFARMGIKLSQSFIDLEGILQWAKTIPRVIRT